jgi:hypothetical protein
MTEEVKRSTAVLVHIATKTVPISDRAVVSINDADTLHHGIRVSGKLRKTCLILYTGGTIGMTSGADGIKRPNPGQLQKVLASLPEVQHPDVPQYDLLEWAQIMDSSDFSPACWIKLAKQIERHYYDYDGFVILHGASCVLARVGLSLTCCDAVLTPAAHSAHIWPQRIRSHRVPCFCSQSSCSLSLTYRHGHNGLHRQRALVHAGESGQDGAAHGQHDPARR